MTYSPTVRSFDRRNGRPNTRDKTGPQVAYSPFLSDPILAKPGVDLSQTRTFRTDTYRNVLKSMLIDPTISFIRELAIQPIVSAEWAIGREPNAPEGSAEFIDKQMKAIRPHLVEHAAAGTIDYGWQTFEKIYSVTDEGIVLDIIKPLLEDITDILVYKDTGEYLGIRQNNFSGSINNFMRARMIDGDLVTGTAFLNRDQTALYNINVKGTGWYGRPLMANCIIPYEGWNTANSAADRYDNKVSGTHFVVHYPYGVGELNGIEVDNFDIAESLLQNLESSGGFVVPRYIDETLMELNKDAPDAWKIELLSDSTNQQAGFVDRLKYYDNLKARALHFPERAILEGSFGTKAESATQADFAIMLLEARHNKITYQSNSQLVNHLMLLNYGRKSVGTVYLKPSPIADDKRIFLREVFMEILRKDIALVMQNFDLFEVRERLGLPVVSADEVLDIDEIKERNTPQKINRGDPGDIDKTLKDESQRVSAGESE